MDDLVEGQGEMLCLESCSSCSLRSGEVHVSMISLVLKRPLDRAQDGAGVSS
jgi:hypothetical protein